MHFFLGKNIFAEVVLVSFPLLIGLCFPYLVLFSHVIFPLTPISTLLQFHQSSVSWPVIRPAIHNHFSLAGQLLSLRAAIS
jgi:hypothetical protein